MAIRNSLSPSQTSCGSMRFRGVYAICTGGVGSGRGDPLMLAMLKPGGVGSGSGEPLAERTSRLGGVGSGNGEPLTLRVRGGVGNGRGEPLAERIPGPGGVGSGSGEPLVKRALGGVGSGRGEPLRTATEAAAERLLDKCLTELLTGSRIEIARTQSDR
jgi:hypothetical protein